MTLLNDIYEIVKENPNQNIDILTFLYQNGQELRERKKAVRGALNRLHNRGKIKADVTGKSYRWFVK